MAAQKGLKYPRVHKNNVEQIENFILELRELSLSSRKEQENWWKTPYRTPCKEVVTGKFKKKVFKGNKLHVENGKFCYHGFEGYAMQLAESMGQSTFFAACAARLQTLVDDHYRKGLPRHYRLGGTRWDWERVYIEHFSRDPGTGMYPYGVYIHGNQYQTCNWCGRDEVFTQSACRKCAKQIFEGLSYLTGSVMSEGKVREYLQMLISDTPGLDEECKGKFITRGMDAWRKYAVAAAATAEAAAASAMTTFS